MTDHAPRPATIAAWCPTCQTTQACALSPETSDRGTYSCVVCGHPVANPVLRFNLSARELANPAA